MGRLVAVLKNLGFGLAGALWLFVGDQDPSSRPAFLVFGAVTSACSLANLVTIGEWKKRSR